MRIAESLVVPDELERARAASDLVVFAGAGVSMAAPSGLPDFKKLARQIAEARLGWDEGLYGKRLDVYLGEAARQGVLVQHRAREILATGRGHAPAHEHVLSLFGTPDAVRLITTNFDSHFDAAATVVFPGAEIPRYIGPALPPGDRFRGIVQLHGSLGSRQDDLVLTDQSFADAYMAEGWASRFLVRVLAQRTVLFVGYRLGDPVMQYLLRAIRPTSRWYALWHENEAEAARADHWIEPVTFATASNGERFGNLYEGLRHWAWYARAAPSAHVRTLRDLVIAGPPALPREADYVRARLSDQRGREEFWACATAEAWFAWAATEGLLAGLTDRTASAEDVARWGRWALTHFCTGDNTALLRFLRRGSLTLHPQFLVEIGLHICAAHPIQPRPVVSQLVALIVSQNPPAARLDWAVGLLARLAQEAYVGEAIAMLRWLTQLHLRPLERELLLFERLEDDTRLAPLAIYVAMVGSPGELVDAFTRHATAMRGAYDDVISLAEQRLREAYALIALAHGSDGKSDTGDIDTLSYGRTAIVATNQDPIDDPEDVLVALVRVALDDPSEAGTARRQAFARRHDASALGLLRRLALHAYAQDESLGSGEVLRRAAIRKWAADIWIRPEFYRVLVTHYPRADEDERAEFVASLRDPATWKADDAEFSARTRFQLAKHLRTLAPESPSTVAFEAEEERANPGAYAGDPDGFLSGGSVGSTGWGPSPIPESEMSTWDAPEAARRLRMLLITERSIAKCYGILAELGRACVKHPAWAVDLLSAFEGDDPITSQLAGAVERALRTAKRATGDQVALLRRIVEHVTTQRVPKALGRLILGWAETPHGEGGGVEWLDALDAAAEHVYDRTGDDVPSVEDGNWSRAARNHPAGDAALVWWAVAERRDFVDDQFVLSLDDREKARWTDIATSTSSSAAFARPILGMAVARLAAGDAPWAARTILPLFDPSSDRLRAAQVWDGLLTASSWDMSAVAAVRPYVMSLLREAASLVPARWHELGNWAAELVCAPDEIVLTHDELIVFAAHPTPGARETFARLIPRCLANVSADRRRRIWQVCLRPYWRDRRTGVPQCLTPDELRSMLRWIVALPEVATEVVAELKETPLGNVTGVDGIIPELAQNEAWVREHATDAVSIVLFITTQQAITRPIAERAVDVLELARAAGAPATVVRDAAEALIRVGAFTAEALLQRVQPGAPGSDVRR